MKLKGWRTILFNGALMAVALAQELPPGPVMVWTALIGNTIIRLFTSTPVGRSEPDPPNADL